MMVSLANQYLVTDSYLGIQNNRDKKILNQIVAGKKVNLVLVHKN